ncbi:MAG: 6-phospho-beta-glucosidase [Brevinematales bacterium]|nr:6-phospho-beta-glucosidase [Brevinematales bacterium]
MKIAIIGGGSSYTPELIEGIIERYERLKVNEIWLVDIKEGEEKLKIIANLTKRMINKFFLPIKVFSTLNHQEAIDGADFVINQIRVGGLVSREKDETIPIKYKTIGQETTGAGGFANALRTIPVVLKIAKIIEKTAKKATLINFTNPAGIITETLLNYTDINTIGLCNVPINMIYEISEIARCKPEELFCKFAGLNHLSFISQVLLKGKDITGEIIEAEEREIVKNIKKIKKEISISGLYNIIPSPYLSYYFFRNKMLEEESNKIPRAREVMKIEKKLFEKYSNENLNEKPQELSQRGGSRYSLVAISLIDSIYNDKRDIHVINIKNNGAIKDLPDNSVVETNAIVGRNGITPLSYGELPITLKGLIQQVKYYEILTIEAAIEKNYNKALKALTTHPLIGDVEIAKNILDDILYANKDFIPEMR